MAGLEISKQFEQFSIFAADAMMHGNTKAIARTGAQLVGPDGPRKIEVTTDDKVYAFKRSQVNKDANDATRELFLKAVADTFNGKQNIPPSVLKALNMKDFNAGKPLTARRIEAVKAAIQDVNNRLRAADQMLADALPRNGLVLRTVQSHSTEPQGAQSFHPRRPERDGSRKSSYKDDNHDAQAGHRPANTVATDIQKR